jgi:hypothetical protein
MGARQSTRSDNQSADTATDTAADAVALLKCVTTQTDALTEALENHDHRRGREKARGKVVQVRRVGDASFRTFTTMSDAEKAFGLRTGAISLMLNRSCKQASIVELRKTIEVKRFMRKKKGDCTIVDRDIYEAHARRLLGIKQPYNSKKINLFTQKKYIDPRASSLLSRIAASSTEGAVVSARAAHRERRFVPECEGFTDEEVIASLGQDVSAEDAALWAGELGAFVDLVEEHKSKLARGDLDAAEVEKLAQVRKLMDAHFRLAFFTPGRCVGQKFRLFHLCKGDVRLLHARLMSMDRDMLVNLPLKVASFWSADDEARLRALVGELRPPILAHGAMGRDETWAAIASRLGTRRSAHAVADHWIEMTQPERPARKRGRPRKRGRVAGVVEPSRGRSSSRRKRSSK